MKSDLKRIQGVLECSSLMMNTDRIEQTGHIWKGRVCQNLYRKTKNLYTNIYNCLIGSYSEASTVKDEDIEYLVICLLRETLNPFLVAYEPVFYTIENLKKRYVRKADRQAFMQDYLAIQEVVAKLCEDIGQIEAEVAGIKTRTNGIN